MTSTGVPLTVRRIPFGVKRRFATNTPSSPPQSPQQGRAQRTLNSTHPNEPSAKGSPLCCTTAIPSWAVGRFYKTNSPVQRTGLFQGEISLLTHNEDFFHALVEQIGDDRDQHSFEQIERHYGKQDQSRHTVDGAVRRCPHANDGIQRHFE